MFITTKEEKMKEDKERISGKIVSGVLIIVLSAVVLNLLGIDSNGKFISDVPEKAKEEKNNSNSANEPTENNLSLLSIINGIWEVETEENSEYQSEPLLQSEEWKIRMNSKRLKIERVHFPDNSKYLEIDDVAVKEDLLSFLIIESRQPWIITEYNLRKVSNNVIQGKFYKQQRGISNSNQLAIEREGVIKLTKISN